MLKLYVEYLCTGTNFMKVSNSHSIDSCEVPDDAYAYRFVQKDAEWYKETTIFVSDTIYLGKIYSVEQALQEFPEDSIILENFAKLSYFTSLIRTRTGHWLPYREGMTVIDI